MLTGIGIFIVLKEIPYFFGYEVPINGGTTWKNIANSIQNISAGPTLIGVIGLAILILWDRVLSKKGKNISVNSRSFSGSGGWNYLLYANKIQCQFRSY
jgi:MFS superfamily sulfate permease-like transporter